MSREIKFRAYNIKRKEMYTVYSLSEDFVYKDTEDGPGNPGVPDKRGDVIVMQYTSLKDKNGVEIYEGDIIEVEWHGKSEVFFMNGSYKIKGRSSKVGFGSMAKKSKVIGNIHENPEILNQSK